MTEDEAKQKWCPMVSLENVTTRFHEKRDGQPGRSAVYAAHCIGSDCMMWRWDAITPEEKRQLREYGDDTGPLLAIPGYCGLGGKL